MYFHIVNINNVWGDLYPDISAKTKTLIDMHIEQTPNWRVQVCTNAKALTKGKRKGTKTKDAQFNSVLRQTPYHI